MTHEFVAYVFFSPSGQKNGFTLPTMAMVLTYQTKLKGIPEDNPFDVTATYPRQLAKTETRQSFRQKQCLPNK